jgi:hypothetical protein
MNFVVRFREMIYKLKGKKTRFIGLTLLTETRVNVEEYGRHGEVLVPLMAVVYKYQTDTKNTGDNGYRQPQAVAERSDVAIPSHIGVVR